MQSSVAMILALAGAGAVHAAPPAAAVDPEGGAGASRAPERTTWVAPRPVDPQTGARGTPAAAFLSTDSAPEADQPMEVVYLRDGSAAVIVHRDTDNITFFDTGTGTITETVAVGDLPSDVAVSPDNTYIVVPNVLGGTVSVIDVATRTVAATIPVTGEQPYSVEVTADSRYAVVGVINDGTNSAFSVIDLGTLAEVRTISSSPQGVIGWFAGLENGIFGEMFTDWALTADGRILLPNRATQDVNVYDALTGAAVTTIVTGTDQPGYLDISDDGTLAVVAHEGTNKRLTTVDLGTLAVVDSFAVGSNLSGRVVRITPDNGYAIAGISNNVIFVDLATGVETARINTGSVGDIELSHDGKYAFVSNFNARVIDVATQTLVGTVPFAPCSPAATSPVGYEAVALNNSFRENIHQYSIDGSSAALLAWAPTGEPAESDATRDLAISPDGRTVVAANNISANVNVIDLASGTIRATIPTGDRPLAAAITPDGAYALVCNTDEPAGGLRGTVSVIDLAADAVVKTITTHDRPAQVRISPDGQTAYVLTVAGSDSIYFIDIDGAASSVIGTAPAGQAGSWFGMAYSVTSEIEVSPDGSLVAVCDSFNDNLVLIDTATRTRVATVGVGDFPISVEFRPDGGRAYVANAFSDNLTVVEINGAASSAVATVATGDSPYMVVADSGGDSIYIGNNQSGAQAIKVLDTASNAIVKTVALGGGQTARTAHLAGDGTLYVGTSSADGGNLLRVSAAGTATAIIDSTPLSGVGSSLVFSESLGTAVVAQPGHIPDGVDVVAFGAPCAADFDGDGTLSVADFSAFREAYLAGDLAADFSGDGDLTVADFSAFRSAYLAGCS